MHHIFNLTKMVVVYKISCESVKLVDIIVQFSLTFWRKRQKKLVAVEKEGESTENHEPCSNSILTLFAHLNFVYSFIRSPLFHILSLPFAVTSPIFTHFSYFFFLEFPNSVRILAYFMHSVYVVVIIIAVDERTSVAIYFIAQ